MSDQSPLLRLLLALQLLSQLFCLARCACNTQCCGQTALCCFQIKEGDALGRFVGNLTQLPEFTNVFTNPQQLQSTMFLGPSIPSFLNLSETSGIVRTASPIDRENKTSLGLDGNNCFGPLNINLMYQQSGSGPQARVARFYVEVLDINDNSPMFAGANLVSVSALETNTKNSMLVCSPQLVAQDADAGPNANISYTVLDNPDFGAFLDNDGTEVCITNHVGVDREQTPAIILTLQASDHGSPPRISNVTLIINVTDVNDNNPVFENSTYAFRVSEDTPVGTVIAILTATDMDVGPNAQIVYRISPIPLSPLPFVLNSSTGALSLTRTLDYETDSVLKYQFTVLAGNSGTNLNSGNSGSATVDVYVLDTNDNPPIARVIGNLNTSEPLRVVEGVQLDSTLVNIIVSDGDDNENSMLKANVTVGGNFYQTGSPTSFGTRQFIFSVFSVAAIDREVVSQINLTIAFSDLGVPPLNDTIMLTVEVLDINDNAPTLTRTNFSVPENTEDGVSIHELHQFFYDPDKGSNGTFGRVEQLSGFGFIDIGSTGSMRAGGRPLDRESMPVFEVTVRLFDAGVPEQNSTLKIYIDILDVNDNAPMFVNTPYIFRIMENTVNNANFGQVMATDRDQGENSAVEYKLTGPYTSLFTIDKISGNLSTNRSFDRETVAVYTVTVIANDLGVPSLTTKINITVVIDDVNDQSPTFASDQQILSILPNPGENKLVGIVQASDRDEAPVLVYSLLGEGAAMFYINRTGAIFTRTSRGFDRPGDVFTLTVRVSDGVFSNTTMVMIMVVEDSSSPAMLIITIIYSGIGAMAFVVIFSFLLACVIHHRRRHQETITLSSISLQELPSRSSLRTTPSTQDGDI